MGLFLSEISLNKFIGTNIYGDSKGYFIIEFRRSWLEKKFEKFDFGQTRYCQNTQSFHEILANFYMFMNKWIFKFLRILFG